MSKTNDTPSLDHGTLADSELEAVSGGTPKLLEYAPVRELQSTRSSSISRGECPLGEQL
jgi:hypothetical protein